MRAAPERFRSIRTCAQLIAERGTCHRYFARNELSRLCLNVLRTATGELLSTEEIAGRVIAAKGFDSGDAIMHTAIREQVGSVVKRLHRNGSVENVGAGRASRWKLAITVD